MVEKLKELEQKVEGFKIEKLAENENFISTVTYASIIAIRNHQEEKLEALRNAVLNTALSPLVEEDLQHMFLNFVDELTPWHLKILRYFQNPEEWFRQREITPPNWTFGSQMHAFALAFPELKTQKDFASQLVRDLSTRGLCQDEGRMNIGVTRNAIFSSRTTRLGKQFIGFVTSPIKR